MRPLQWPKNLLVFMPFAFTAGQAWRLAEPDSWLPLVLAVAVAFVAFCLVSGGEYLVNDVCDREKDRLHPRKRLRPIAAGQLSAPMAVSVALVLFAAGVALAFAVQPAFALIIGAYVLLMVGYSLKLKHVVVLDLLTVSSGFVLRAIGGAIAIAVPVSPWLFIVTLLGALFIVINKRRHEIVLLRGDAANHRPILDEYSVQLLDQMSSIVTASTLIAYGLYTFTAPNLPANHAMMLTVPFVLYGIFRYLYLVHQREAGGSPEEVLLRDRPLLVNAVLWLVTSMAILIVFRQ
jgi:4-hydroxybenzoate polyprenyltransferase